MVTVKPKGKKINFWKNSKAESTKIVFTPFIEIKIAHTETTRQRKQPRLRGS